MLRVLHDFAVKYMTDVRKPKSAAKTVTFAANIINDMTI